MDTTNDCGHTLPLALRPGDTLGIVAPASPFDRSVFDAGARVLEDMGFYLSIHEDVYERNGYLAGSDKHRATHLTRLFEDPKIDGIVCARGGYGAMRILPLLDADLIAAHPKVFVGFSDITALLSFLFGRCRMVCFHGPTVTALGKGDFSTQHHFFSTVTQPAPVSVSTASNLVIQHGNARGPFLCGNLTLFSHLTGTAFQPDFTGSVVLLEDQGEAPYRIDRMLTQMKLAGCFDGVAGVALGTFTHCGRAQEIHAIFSDRLGGLDIPIIAGFDVGHADSNFTLPVGVPVQLDSASGTLRFEGPAIRQGIG